MNKVLLLVLDAADPALIEKWSEAGDLPNIKKLLDHSAHGRIVSNAGSPAEALPFTFHTGQSPAMHGVHSSVIWDPETMSFRPPAFDWLPIRPFWREFSEDGPRAVVLDAANCYAPEQFNGVEIIGWATHDALTPFSAYPPEKADWVHQHYGSKRMPDEIYDTFKKGEFISTRDLMLDISNQYTKLCTDLITTEPWDFFLAYLYSTHHGGHRLWDTNNINEPLSKTEQAEFKDALRQIYIASDKAIGEIIEQTDSDTTIMVLSMHGMGDNHSRGWILPDLLRLILKENGIQTKSFSLLKNLRELIPVKWRHEVKSRLPYSLRRWLTRFWRSGYDWSKTKAFTLISDTQGWVRINLKGREANGIVEPQDYDALCEKISLGLKSFRDADTGKPIIEAIEKQSQVFEGEKQKLLPDLIIHWANSPASQHRAITSPEFGTVPWPTPGQNPEGRSGNHLPEGFFIISGTGIKSGKINNINVLDLAPSILTLLGQPVPEKMEGRVISIFKN